MGKTPRMIFVLITIILLVLSITGCQAQSSEQSIKPSVINISYSLRPINVPTIAALEKKIFEEEFAKEGIEVKWYELEGPATTEALAAKSIDISTSLNYVSAITSKANGNDIKIISSYSRFPEAIGLIAGIDSGVSTIADLKGKKVAVQKGTMLHEMLIKALEKEKVAVEEVEIVGMASPDAVNAVLQKHVSAAIIPDPLLTKAISSNKVKLLTNAEGLILGQAVIAARTDFLEQYPDTAKKFLEIHNNILMWSDTNQDEALQLAADVIQMDIKAVNKLYPKYDFSLAIDEENIIKLKESAGFLKNYNFIKEDVDTDSLVDNLIDTNYLPE